MKKSNITYTKQYKIIKKDTKIKSVMLNSPSLTAEFARNFYGNDISVYESFFVVYLDSNLHTIAWVKIAQGGMRSVIVDVRFIAKYAIETLCNSVIIVHNHPSGNLVPSASDKKLTDTIKNGLSLFDIQLIDHLILTENNYYSFSNEGIL